MMLGEYCNYQYGNDKSYSEIDIDCTCDVNSLEYKILDFLSRITTKTSIGINLTCLEGFSNYRFLPIYVIKYSGSKFRISNV